MNCIVASKGTTYSELVLPGGKVDGCYRYIKIGQKIAQGGWEKKRRYLRELHVRG